MLWDRVAVARGFKEGRRPARVVAWATVRPSVSGVVPVGGNGKLVPAPVVISGDRKSANDPGSGSMGDIKGVGPFDVAGREDNDNESAGPANVCKRHAM